MRRRPDHFLSLELWQDYRDRASVVLVSSCAAGLADAFSDVDVDFLVEHQGYEPLHRFYCEAVDQEAIRILNPRAIRRRLDDRLGLLTGGPRDVPARQRTLCVTIGLKKGTQSCR